MDIQPMPLARNPRKAVPRPFACPLRDGAGRRSDMTFKGLRRRSGPAWAGSPCHIHDRIPKSRCGEVWMIICSTLIHGRWPASPRHVFGKGWTWHGHPAHAFGGGDDRTGNELLFRPSRDGRETQERRRRPTTLAPNRDAWAGCPCHLAPRHYSRGDLPNPKT
jgi:hypothetical protein